MNKCGGESLAAETGARESGRSDRADAVSSDTHFFEVSPVLRTVSRGP